MKYIYLDNNVFVNIENLRIRIEDLTVGESINNCCFPYSFAHIQEAKGIDSVDFEQRKKWIEKRLQTLNTVSKENYLFHQISTNQVFILNQKPLKIFENNFPDLGNCVLKFYANFLSEEIKNQLREELGMFKGFLNNKTCEQVIESLNIKMQSLGQKSILDVVEYSVRFNPDGNSFGLYNRISGIFDFLDMLGYWTDKFNSKSSIARHWDSWHTYFSSFCNYFISDDKRTRKKAEVVFGLYGIDTQIISTKEALAIK